MHHRIYLYNFSFFTSLRLSHLFLHLDGCLVGGGTEGYHHPKTFIRKFRFSVWVCESDHYIEISEGFVKFSIKPPPSRPEVACACHNLWDVQKLFVQSNRADNKNASKNLAGEAPFALTPIKNRIFVIAPKKLFIFEATKIWFWRSGVRVSEWYQLRVYNEALLLLLNTDTLEQIVIFVTLTKNV